MRCPSCGYRRDRVIDSRSAREGGAIRRRRQCLKCGARFTTYEEILRTHPRIIKRDGRYEDFDRQKLMAGILRACEKRPISLQTVELLVDQVIGQLEQSYEREVPSSSVGELVMDRLKQLDAVAYVRFASVYRQFKDVGQFLAEIETLTELSAARSETEKEDLEHVPD